MGNTYDLTISSPIICKDLTVDDSVSVNGCCQTVVELTDEALNVMLLKYFKKPTFLHSRNLITSAETSLKLGSGIGGHLVQGHGTHGKIKSISNIKNFYVLEICYEYNQYANYVTSEGSISIDRCR